MVALFKEPLEIGNIKYSQCISQRRVLLWRSSSKRIYPLEAGFIKSKRSLPYYRGFL